MEYFAKIVDCIQLLTSFVEHFILSVSQGYEYVSRKNKQKPDAMSFIPQKNQGCNRCRFPPLSNSILSLHNYLTVRYY